MFSDDWNNMNKSIQIVSDDCVCVFFTGTETDRIRWDRRILKRKES